MEELLRVYYTSNEEFFIHTKLNFTIQRNSNGFIIEYRIFESFGQCVIPKQMCDIKSFEAFMSEINKIDNK